MRREWSRCAIACALLVLAGCALQPARVSVPVQQAAPPPAPVPEPAPRATSNLPHYRCDNDIEFDARFAQDAVELVFANREPEKLLRDAGGLTAQETVYSSTGLKAHFGLDPAGRGAKLNFASPPLESRCVRD